MAIFLIAFVILLVIGVPISISIGASAVLGCLSLGYPLVVIGQKMVSGVDSFLLIAVPLFILAGNLMNAGKITEKIFDACKELVGWIPGGLGQIGKNMAREFYERGAKVAVFARHVNPEKVEAIFPKEKYDGERMKFYAVDINRKDTIEAALDAMEQAWGDAPDVLINNAGIDTQPSAPPEVSGPFENFPEEVFREVVDTNLVGTFLCCQAVGSRMVKAGKGGSIINVGSIYGMLSPIQDIYKYKEERTGIPFIKPVAYSAAKSGIYNLTRYLATYWGKKGIRVNTLTPAGVWRDTQDETFIANFTARMPMGRMSHEDEYNGAVIFLASQASSFMTGANLVIDGGWTAW